MSVSGLTIVDLPNELLVAIAAAGQEGRVPDGDLQPMIFKTEWTLSHLSRRFRDVISEAPALWTLVESNLDAEGSVEIFKLYLKRSRACNIWATLRQSQELVDYYLIERRLNVIVHHVHRIWRLRIVLRMGMGRMLLAPFRDAPAPNLQHLEVELKSFDPLCGRPPSVELFVHKATTKLAFLIADGLKIQRQVPQWAASLTHLELRKWQKAPDLDNIDVIIAFTMQCQSLVHLHLDLVLQRPLAPTTPRLRIPLLKSFHLSISYSENDSYLLKIVELFDTPSLTEFIIDGTHGDQVFALFNSTNLPSSFPTLTSLSFVNRLPCSCETQSPFSNPISAAPLGLFPILSSLTLINQCFTTSFVNDILSLPWPHLSTITLAPQPDTLVDVRGALRDATGLKRQRGQSLPKLRLSAPLASSLEEIGVDVEIFDPSAILNLFCSKRDGVV